VGQVVSAERFRVERYSRRLGLAETLRDVEASAARRIVEADLNRGDVARMQPESRVRPSGRYLAP